ncbi:MAG: TAXI family TRAP transporter solute-binding subunit [Candidatus Thiodiazotropha sp. (ex Lucinoma borealis)]|nr:TAXI family TRAP transporter solute-binding subunit [Candidatus Thiodiazotropha sp. (ex Lucinoma borealis)]
MKKKEILLLFFISTFFQVLPFASSAANIASGQVDGIYHLVGTRLLKLVQSYVDKDSKLIQTDGSIHNLELLAAHKADLAIVQADILYRIHNAKKNDALYTIKESLLSMQGIAALFPEYTQVLVRKDDKISKIMSLIGKRLYIGKRKSGSFRNAIDLLASHGISSNDCILNETLNSYSEALSALLSGNLDAVIITSHERQDQISKYQDKLRLLSIDSHTRKIIEQNYPYFEFTSHQNQFSGSIHLLFTRAVLVAGTPDLGSNLPHSNVRELTAAISNDLALELAKNSNRNVDLFKGQQMVQGIPLPIHHGSLSYFTDQGFVVSLIPLTIWISFLFVIVVIVAFSQYGHNLEIVFQIRNRLSNRTRNASYVIWEITDWIARRTWIVTIILVLLFLSLIFFIILHLENSHSAVTGAQNHFAGREFAELFTWIVSMSSMGGLYSQTIIQNSILGQGVSAFIPFVSYGSALFLFIHHLIKKSQRKELEEQGIYVPHLTDHIVICGWNLRAPNVIREITAPNPWIKSKKVVVIAEFPEEKPLKGYDFRQGYVYYCRGISSDYQKLRLARIEDATSSLVLADPRKLLSQNIRGLMTVTGIRSHITKSDHSIITELYYSDNDQKFKSCGANKIVSLDQITTRLITHACMNPGISDVISNILSLTSTQTASLASLTLNLEIQNIVASSTFKEASIALRKKGILLLSIYRHDPSHTHSETELDFHPTKSPYIINPSNDADREYKIRIEDQLILIQPQPSFYPSKAYGKNLDPCRSSSMFNLGEENVLIVGNSSAAFNVADMLLPHCKAIIHLIPADSDHNNGSHEEKLIRRIINGTDKESFNKIISEFEDDFRKITRCILFAQKKDFSTHKNTDEQGIYQDDYVMSVTMTLRTVFEESLDNANLHIVAELHDDTNIDLYHDLNIAQPVPINRVIELTLSKMAYFNGLVSEFLLKSMSYESSNNKSRLEKRAVVQLPAPLKEIIIGSTYDELVTSLLSNNIQLLAFKKSDGRIIINPAPTSDESKEVLQIDDCLFVFITP